MSHRFNRDATPKVTITINRTVSMLMYGPLVFRPLWQSHRGSVVGPSSKTLIVLSDSQHRVFGLRIIQLARESTRLFCADAPVVGLIDQAANPFPRLPSICKFVTAEQEIGSA